MSTGLSDLAVELPDCGVLSAADSLPSKANGLLSKAGSTTTSGLHPIVQAITIEPAVTVGGVTAVGTTVSGATDVDTTAGVVGVVVTAVGGVTESGTIVGKVPVADTSCVCVLPITDCGRGCPGVWLGTAGKFNNTVSASQACVCATSSYCRTKSLFNLTRGRW